MSDLISRSDAIGAVKEERFPIDSDYAEGFMAALDKVEWILKEWLPSAQPEPLDEWCTDCKEYDKNKHCCPRWNRVIRTTLKNMKEEQPEIIRCKDCIKREICRTSTTWAVAPKDDWYCADAERRTE